MRRLHGVGRIALGALLAGCIATGAALAETPAPAPTPRPPLPYSGYPARIGSETATINAAVNPRGAETSYYLQYGPSLTYGFQTQALSVGGGTAEVKVSVALTGLQADTTFHYRLVAVNSAGTAIGPDRAFITKKIPLTLTVTVAPNPDPFGTPLSVSGNLAGSENANQELVLQYDPYPYKQGFLDLGRPELSDATGDFSFTVPSLAGSAQLRVAALGPPTVYGPVSTERVSAHVVLHLHATRRPGFYRLYGSVAPALPGAHVAFQRAGSDGRPVNLSGTISKSAGIHRSRFARTLALHLRGRYRAAVQSTTPALLSGHSSWIGLRRIRHRR